MVLSLRSVANCRFQGITHSINIPLSKKLTSRDVRSLYQDRYAGEVLVTVSGEAPLVRDISGKHGVAVGGFAVASSGDRVVVVATIDNLLKGAATQALQNINLSLVCPSKRLRLTLGIRRVCRYSTWLGGVENSTYRWRKSF